VISVPWHGIVAVSAAWGLVGLGGIVYTVVVVRRLRAQTIYEPVFEDWMCHAMLPFAAFGMLTAAAFVAQSNARPAMFAVGAATLLFLFVGIHNAWDAATYHLFSHERGDRNS
jgi:hypothetical protein